MFKDLCARYYKKKKRFKESLMKGIKNLLKKSKKQEYGGKQFKNLSEIEKERLVEYRKNIINCEKINICYKQRLLIL